MHFINRAIICVNNCKVTGWVTEEVFSTVIFWSLDVTDYGHPMKLHENYFLNSCEVGVFGTLVRYEP